MLLYLEATNTYLTQHQLAIFGRALSTWQVLVFVSFQDVVHCTRVFSSIQLFIADVPPSQAARYGAVLPFAAPGSTAKPLRGRRCVLNGGIERVGWFMDHGLDYFN